ncbi:S41 family peptidase [Deinococcus yavapaiensis]|uniref:C-terminal peptidase prc n=1 Tax=Deinococcus yavapaiensis KR-236 TaxID=694435 RepID=A0A318STS7_9DEIO|nr:S41 family peptidase [Deinococcus yavapaiensis]PYE56636.1 C-terminal peptidase prc [Deinococcus yavapaiensis KR-236]
MLRRTLVLLSLALAASTTFATQSAQAPSTAPVTTTAPTCPDPYAVGTTADANANARTLTQEQRVNLFDAFVSTAQKYYIDPKFGGKDWTKLSADARVKALAATTDAAFYNEIRSLVSIIDDAHFYFLSPQEAREDDEGLQNRNTYGGIGVQIGKSEDNNLLISFVMPGTPAEKSGVRAGEVIVAVDGKACPTVPQVRGEAGTTVTLTLRSPSGSTRQVQVVRASVNSNPAPAATRLKSDEGVVYLQLNTFSYQGSANDALTLLRSELAKGPVKGLVLDLRANSGGLISEGQRFLSAFANGVFGEWRDRAGRSQPYLALTNPLRTTLSQVPLVILTSNNTASMAEITTAVLRYRLDAKVLGQRTYNIIGTTLGFPLPLGARAYITQTDFYLPNGVRVGEKGIDPDVDLPVSAIMSPNEDPVVTEALKVLSSVRGAK